jgi:hypothetical protein
VTDEHCLSATGNRTYIRARLVKAAARKALATTAATEDAVPNVRAPYRTDAATAAGRESLWIREYGICYPFQAPRRTFPGPRQDGSIYPEG